ncbi:MULTISPECIES: MFS transporter [unclassified Burkholderia]|uniref:MFS transporter n=1 Tax=unclassified Burkholderia TaxID=2613784 RepID=UPI000F570B1A|nr:MULTISPECIES: MFS transporter [unclassified Burkholderia]RQR43404.1 MFS transporter [Burkholderia sp. Bp9131]RQR74276.1 MFS transporter [Burkholderia sp. Bp9015]RQS01162.1 MFS transporter [Burkholderia sp. Bp8994]RQS28152.1 MFS transporter [Burkholderia sp. Bp8995]RQS46798.1 MFS transporter [Burkholderia sp. Bp8989]
MRQINLQALSDDARLGPLHGVVLFWCALIIVFDGYDLAVAGIALPAIMKNMGVSPAHAGFMVSSALFGMMFGNIVFGTVAERIGRRRAIAACLTLFSVFTAAAGLAPTPALFGAARFLAGIGIGGVMPNVIAHMTEYAPRRMRSTLVTLMFSGYSVGGMLAAVMGKGMIEAYGWRSVFVAAGAPVLLVPLLMKWMPESMSFLIRRGRTGELARIACRLDPAYRPRPDDCHVLPREEQAGNAPVRRLFDDGRGFSTVMFWIACFMCLFMVYALSSWLTRLMAGAGYSLGSALTFVLVLNAGAMVGAIGGGWLADRFPIKTVLVSMYLLAAISITLLGYRMPTALLFVLVGLAGASTIGTQIVNCAYAGQFYPVAIRSTGIGWTLGIGRGGAILAPIVIGVLVGIDLPLERNFMAIGLPALAAALAVGLIDHRRSASHRDQAGSPGERQQAYVKQS